MRQYFNELNQIFHRFDDLRDRQIVQNLFTLFYYFSDLWLIETE